MVIDLSFLPASAGFIVRGAAAGDEAGRSVSSVGDLNGDGFDDLVIGAPFGDEAGDLAGEVYVVFGKAGATRASIDLGTLAASDGFVIQGGEAGDRAGWSVSSAGDINGDGLDDLVIGLPFAYGYVGKAYVVLGKAGASRADIDLGALPASDGFAIVDSGGSYYGYDYNGFSASSAGDVNGDGIDDLVIGAPHADNYGGNAFVIFGKAGATRADIDLAALADGDGFALPGGGGFYYGYDYIGWSVSSAGDINGDGIDDLVIGAPYDGAGGDLSGVAYVVFGKAGATREDVFLGALASADGFVVQGDAAGNRAGWSVSSAGDVNGDGIDDLIVGAPHAYDYSGNAYVIFGKEGAARGNVDLGALADGDGFALLGGGGNYYGYDYTSWSVSSAGDVNGDGIDDLVIGAPSDGEGGDYAGAAYVIFGKAGATRADIALSELAPGDGLIIRGDAAGDRAGWSVSSAGDVNGDGYDDLIIGARGGDDGGADAGEAYVLFGRAGFTGNVPPPGNQWRLFASDGFAGEIRGSGAIFGGAGLQDIAVLDIAGGISFEPSFNRGGDIIRLVGDAPAWQVWRLGSSAVLSDGDTFVTVPAGTTGVAVVFDDGARTLRFDTGLGSMMIGGQSFGSTPVAISAAADGTVLPSGVDPAAPARLFFASGAEVTAGGKLAVFGTAAAEEITLTRGDVSLDPSFNKGGDILVLGEQAADFTAVRIGSSVRLEGSLTDVVIPVGAAGMTLSFPDGDDRVLRYDAALASVVIGTQPIGSTSAGLTDIA